MFGYRRFQGVVRGLRGEGRGWLLLAVATGWFVILGMRFVVPGILPTIAGFFQVSDAQAGLAVTVLWVTYAVMQFPAGFYADRVGERRILSAGLLLAAAGLASYAFTPSFSLFVVATGIFGLGTGLYGPTRGTAVSKAFDENDGAAFGVMLAAGSLGAAALPAVAAIAVSAVGWRLTLAAAAPGLLLAAVGVWWALPDGRRDDENSHTLRDAIRESVEAIGNRRIALAVAGATLMLFAFQAATAFLTTYLVDMKGLTQGTAGALLGALFVVGAVSQSICGGLADRFGAPRVLTGIGVVSVLPLVALPYAEGLLAVGVLSALIGVRMSIGPVSNAYIIGLLPEEIKGTAWGGLRTGFFLVGSFGSTVVGIMADAGLFDAAFYVLATLTAIGAGIYVFLPERP